MVFRFPHLCFPHGAGDCWIQLGRVGQDLRRLMVHGFPHQVGSLGECYRWTEIGVSLQHRCHMYDKLLTGSGTRTRILKPQQALRSCHRRATTLNRPRLSATRAWYSLPPVWSEPGVAQRQSQDGVEYIFALIQRSHEAFPYDIGGTFAPFIQ